MNSTLGSVVPLSMFQFIPSSASTCFSWLMLRGVSQSLYWGWGISTLKKRLLISDEKLSLSTYLIQKFLFWAYLIKKCRSVFQASFKSILGLSHAFFWDQICGLSAKRKNKDKQDLYIFRHSEWSLLLRCHCCSSRVSSSRQASAQVGSHRGGSISFIPISKYGCREQMAKVEQNWNMETHCEMG